ncbi:MAG: lytic transglycosylase domain-containing protein [Gammaproteobacteria bacterium]|nr:lytic transglycosylase domain-containing protein [Gammaproteobacteria bacterium]
MGKLAVLMLTGLMFAAPAAQGALYRCVGADGIPNYSSKRVSNAVCKSVSTGAGANRVSRSSASKIEPAKPAEVVPVATAAIDAGVASTPPAAGASKQVVFSTSPAVATGPAPKASGSTRVLRGAVYRFERDGVTHYTNVRPRGAAQSKLLFSYVETCYACGLMPNVNFGSVRLNTSAYSSEIRDAASRFGVDEYIVRAIIHAESAYRPNAISHAGAQGLMQLIPATASRFGVSDPFDPAQNISGGVKYLAWLMKRYSSNLTLVAAAYNAGEGAVDRNGGVPPYSETQRYVQRVGQLADRYRSALAKN